MYVYIYTHASTYIFRYGTCVLMHIYAPICMKIGVWTVQYAHIDTHTSSHIPFYRQDLRLSSSWIHMGTKTRIATSAFHMETAWPNGWLTLLVAKYETKNSLIKQNKLSFMFGNMLEGLVVCKQQPVHKDLGIQIAHALRQHYGSKKQESWRCEDVEVIAPSWAFGVNREVIDVQRCHTSPCMADCLWSQCPPSKELHKVIRLQGAGLNIMKPTLRYSSSKPIDICPYHGWETLKTPKYIVLVIWENNSYWANTSLIGYMSKQLGDQFGYSSWSFSLFKGLHDIYMHMCICNACHGDTCM